MPLFNPLIVRKAIESRCNPEHRERNYRIMELRFAGHTLKAIGEAVGLSTERIREIIRMTNFVIKKYEQR